MLFEVDDSTPFDIQVETTLKTNFFATRNVCTELLPIMKPHGKSSVGLCPSGSSHRSLRLGYLQESPRAAMCS